MYYYDKQEFEILNPFFVKYCDFMGEITCTKCELTRKPTMCTVKINFILLIWALSVNCMDMPWVQSLAQSEDYRNPLCAILYTHGSNNFHKVRTAGAHFMQYCVPMSPIAFTK
jgi:hypothetical protein